MSRTSLGVRELNRATLARQQLLERATMPVPELVEHLVGFQAQTPHTWYVGLWTRLTGLRPEQVSDLVASRELVRIALMRSTIHLVTARDALGLRHLFGPVLERSYQGNFGKHLAGVDRTALAVRGRAILHEHPMIFSELGRALARGWPERDAASLAQAIRASEPLVQVTPRGLWGRSGPAAHTTLEHWLGRPLTDDVSVDQVVLRYLDAFGPASVRDVQAWCGLTRLSEVVDRLRPRLVRFAGPDGRELFDLPEAPRPGPDVPAPARFLYDFDNLLLSHADRTRFITDRYLEQGYTVTGPMPRVVLLDGFTAAGWTVEESRGSARLTVTPYGRLSRASIDALTVEGGALLAFLTPREPSTTCGWPGGRDAPLCARQRRSLFAQLAASDCSGR